MSYPVTTYNSLAAAGGSYAISHLTLGANALLPQEQHISYTVFDKVARISNGHGEARIVYGLDHHRAVLKEDFQPNIKSRLPKFDKKQNYLL